MVTIRHTAIDGTTVEGTERGDGSAELLKARGLRWWRVGRCWYIGQSRAKRANEGRIGMLADALREAGFEVEVDIERVSVAEAEEARSEVAAQRAEALGARAERLSAAAEGHRARSHAATAGIPFGQPILVGHHSERRHRNAIEKSWSAFGKSVEAQRAADEAERRAESASREDARRSNPTFIGNRIDDAETEMRAAQRELDEASAVGAAESYIERQRERLAEAEEKRDYWQGERDRVGAPVFSKETVKPGDLVRIRGSWMLVVRSNAKTVAGLDVMPWPLNYRWHEVKGHREGTDESRALLAAHKAERKATREAMKR